MAYVPDDQHHAEHPEHGHPNYRSIFILLCVCTAISWALDELEGLSIPLPAAVLVAGVLIVALVKAGAVMSYFMHLKFEGNWKFIILMPTAILAVGLMVALAPDMALHYYTNDAPQSKVVMGESSHDDHGHASSGESHGGAETHKTEGHGSHH